MLTVQRKHIVGDPVHSSENRDWSWRYNLKLGVTDLGQSDLQLVHCFTCTSASRRLEYLK